MRPAVSIVVPVYKVEQYLDRCVQSLIQQTLKNIEIILVDDGSPDRCPELCDVYAKKDSRIKVIHKENAGLGMARNTGIEAATGEFVTFVDSDDYVELIMYENLYKRAVNESADAVISGKFIRELSNGMTLSSSIDKELIFEEDMKQLILGMLGSKPEHASDYVYEPSACKGIYRLDVLKKNNVLFHSERELISEDYIFHLDLLQHTKKVIVVRENYYHYFQNGATLTTSYQENRFEKNVAMFNYLRQRFDDLGYSQEDWQYAERIFLAWARTAIMQISGHYPFFNKNLRREILNICHNTELIDVLSHYKVALLPIKQRVFAYGMGHKVWIALYFFSMANSKVKWVLWKRKHANEYIQK